MKKLAAIFLSFAVAIFIGSFFQTSDVYAASSDTINVKKSVQMTTSNSIQLHPKAKKYISKKGYIYTSSDNKIAIVTPTGKINAIRKGNAKITIISRAKRSVKTTVKLKVANCQAASKNLRSCLQKRYLHLKNFSHHCRAENVILL